MRLAICSLALGEQPHSLREEQMGRDAENGGCEEGDVPEFSNIHWRLVSRAPAAAERRNDRAAYIGCREIGNRRALGAGFDGTNQRPQKPPRGDQLLPQRNLGLLAVDANHHHRDVVFGEVFRIAFPNFFSSTSVTFSGGTSPSNFNSRNTPSSPSISPSASRDSISASV